MEPDREWWRQNAQIRAERLARFLDSDYPEILIGQTWAGLFESMTKAFGDTFLEEHQVKRDRIVGDVDQNN